MNRKDRLMFTKTPDSSLQIDTDDSIFFEKPKLTKKKLNHPRRIKLDSVIFIFKKYYRYFLVGLMLVLFSFPTRKSHINVNVVKELKNEIELLRIQNKELSYKFNFINKEYGNIALIEKGCVIDYAETSLPYSYGVFNTNYIDPHTVILDDLECYSFKGSKGQIVFSFVEKKKICGIGIFHKKTKNLASSPEDIVFLIDNKKVVELSFNPKVCIFQKIDFEETTGNTLKFLIKNNHGNKNFTCIYRLFVYGQ